MSTPFGSRKGGIDTLPNYIIGILLAIPFLFIGANLFASMTDNASRSAQDLDVIIERVSELDHLGSRSIVLHHMEQRRDYLVFMNSSEEFNIYLSKNNLLGNEKEGPTIRFRPEGCSEGSSCVCIFKDVDLRENSEGDIYPRTTMCRPLPHDFYSGPIPIMTSFSEDDVETFESYDAARRNQVTQSIVRDSEDLEIGEAAAAFGITATIGATVGTVAVLKIGGLTLLGIAGSVAALPVALVGLAGVGVYSAVLGFTGDDYDHVLVDKEDVVIYTNQYEDTTFVQVLVQREGDYLVTCPIPDYCDNLAEMIRIEIQDEELDGASLE